MIDGLPMDDDVLYQESQKYLSQFVRGDYNGIPTNVLEYLRVTSADAEDSKGFGVQPKTATYSIRDFMDVATAELPPQKFVWGGMELASGECAEIIGPPGLGKSRFALNLAVHQVLGRPFAHPDYTGNCPPLRWLFMGTENSLRRWNHDARAISETLTQGERELLRTRIFLPTLEADGDTYLSLSDAANVQKCKDTFRQWSPNVAVWDPWGDLCADELNDATIRDTVRVVREIARCSACPDVLSILLNHSKMGKNVYLSAVSDGENYGRNSKALYGQMRNVYNLRPAYQEPERFGDGIEIIDQKHNNRTPLPKAAVGLDRGTMLYSAITDYDHDAAQAEWERLSGKTSGGSTSSSRGRQLTQDEMRDYLPLLAKKVAAMDDAPARCTLRTLVMTEAHATRTCADYIIDHLSGQQCGTDTIEKWNSNGEHWGTPYQHERFEAEKAKRKCRT